MKQEEIDRIVAALQALPYEHHDGFNRYSIESIRSVLASLDQTGIDGWISVDERLPENTDYVLVITPPSKPVLGYYDIENGTWHDYDDLKYIYGIVTHWQPLPPAPLEQFKNDEG